MFIKYKLKKGEDFKSAMRKHKINDWAGIWNLKGNASLRRKRKQADKVTEGDILILFDGRVKYHKVPLGNKTHYVHPTEWSATTKLAIKELNKQFLNPLGKVKKIYDDDFNFLQSLAEDNAIAGFFAALVEDRTGAKLPTKEMAAASAATRDLQKKILAGKFGEVEAAAKKAQDAMNKYAAASELYRRKMTNGATKGVKVVKFVDDYAFMFCAALATGGGSVALSGTLTVAQVAGIAGAGTALIKSSSSEIGKSIAGEVRSGEEITFDIVSKTIAGGLEGYIGARLLGSKVGTRLVNGLASRISGVLGKTAEALLRAELPALIRSPSLIAALGKDVVSKEAALLIARTSLGTIKIHVKKALNQNEDVVASAVKACLKKMTGRDDDKGLANLLADELLGSKLHDEIVRNLIKGQNKLIVKELEKLEVTG